MELGHYVVVPPTSREVGERILQALGRKGLLDVDIKLLEGSSNFASTTLAIRTNQGETRPTYPT